NAYLDDALDATQRMAFEELLRTHPQLRQEWELQARIDASMGRLFQPVAPTENSLAALRRQIDAERSQPASRISSPSLSTPSGASSTRRAALILTLAATLGWVVVGFWRTPDRGEPYFAPEPLADLYRQTLKAGFEPYYECDEPDRFAATFLKRQGRPLALAPMPLGASMLGLSYPGGLSRQTTAMLCLVDEAKVMVFVDRVEADQRIAADNAGPDLHVFRTQRDGLVFYEVTPLETSRMSDLLIAAAVPSL
ncbi:MAG: hypothetical protein KDA61_09150, partial [Planctomycetales bacterium]|nr:hypothetical protein [Planctomycetales bacterium]